MSMSKSEPADGGDMVEAGTLRHARSCHSLRDLVGHKETKNMHTV